jgi:3-dehydroshikimate dehydratase
MRFTPALVSITFRKLTPEQIVALCEQAELGAIEWGGDVHVPHGNVERARHVREICEQANIKCYAYGSYYRAGEPEGEKNPSFQSVLDTAIELGAPSIRVWAGTMGSRQADASVRDRVASDLKRMCKLAHAKQTDIALEYHGGTLTDEPEATVALLKQVDEPNLKTYWQPRHGLPVETHLQEIRLLRPWLRDVHAFHWWPDANTRLPLSDGADRWRAFLAELATDGRDRTVALEFVQGEREEQLLADAATLHQLLG